ncbi:MAG TPA: AI-2E family transporter, partial [Fimbriimonadaceae bacterium]|nr:AI-2E family transporter [Fimbriimonadaceae bacterium]
VVTTIYIAYLIREIWIPLALAFLIAMILDPVVDRLERRGWSRTWGSVLIYAAFLASVGLGLWLAVPRVIEQGQQINQQISKFVPDRSAAGVQKALDKTNISPAAKQLLARGVQQVNKSLSSAGEWVGSHIADVASNLVWMVVIPVIAFYALKDFHIILAKGLLLVPRGQRDVVQTMVSEISAIFAKYMRAVALVSLMNAVATWLLLMVLGVPSALILGLVAGLLYSVPYIGAVITVVLIGLIAFLSGGFQHALIVVGATILVQQVLFDYIVMPKVLGGQVGLHPILSIIALLAGNVLLGLIGMILAVPIAASIQMAVLAMVPKLRHEIELPAAPDQGRTVEEISEEIHDTQAQIDATEELHKSVSAAVDNIEAKIEEAPEEEPPQA